MKVVFVLPGYSRKPIGGYRVVFEYCNWLVSHGWEVTVFFATFDLKTDASETRVPSVLSSIKNCLVRAMYARGRRPINWFALDPRVRTTSSRRFAFRRSANGAMIVGTEVSTWSVARELAVMSPVAPVLFMQHYEDWAASPEYIDLYLSDGAFRLIAISGWLVDHARRCGQDAFLVPNAVDSQDFPNGGALGRRPRRVVAMVSPVHEKRADLLFEVFEVLHDAKIDIVTFGVKAAPPGMPPYVKHSVRPTRAELSAILRSARVFVCASDSEGWGLPPAEAMLSGTAVASTANLGVLDYAKGYALFSPIGDSGSLARNTVALIDDVEKAQYLVNQGRAGLLRYSPDDAGAKFESALLQAS